MLSVEASNEDLLDAAKAGDMEQARYALGMGVVLTGADPNTTDSYDSTALHYASAGGNLPLVKMLCEQSGINLEPRDEVHIHPHHHPRRFRHHHRHLHPLPLTPAGPNSTSCCRRE